jgi:hypothetical protein
MPFPSRKGAGDEPIVLRFFIQDAEAGAWHRYENLVVQDLDDNFRSPKPRQFHAYFAHIGMDQTRMIFSWPRSAWTLWARDLSGAVCHAPNQRTLATLPV